MPPRFDSFPSTWSSDLTNDAPHAAPGKNALTQRMTRGAPQPSAPAADAPVQRHLDPAAAAVQRAQQEHDMAAALGFLGGPAASIDESLAIQKKSTDPHTGLTDEQIGAAAATGVGGAGQSLPHLDAIQRSFGAHDVSGVRAHVGGAAADASHAIGASAYATGNDVAFSTQPDLFLAAHEAAHVVQQRQGVHLKGAVGQDGDAYERHADDVAAAVVRGESAEALLGAPGAEAGTAVQRNTTQPQIPPNVAPGKSEITVITKSGDESSGADKITAGANAVTATAAAVGAVIDTTIKAIDFYKTYLATASSSSQNPIELKEPTQLQKDTLNAMYRHAAISALMPIAEKAFSAVSTQYAAPAAAGAAPTSEPAAPTAAAAPATPAVAGSAAELSAAVNEAIRAAVQKQFVEMAAAEVARQAAGSIDIVKNQIKGRFWVSEDGTWGHYGIQPDNWGAWAEVMPNIVVNQAIGMAGIPAGAEKYGMAANEKKETVVWYTDGDVDVVNHAELWDSVTATVTKKNHIAGTKIDEPGYVALRVEFLWQEDTISYMTCNLRGTMTTSSKTQHKLFEGLDVGGAYNSW